MSYSDAEILAAYQTCKSKAKAAKKLGIPPSTFKDNLSRIQAETPSCPEETGLQISGGSECRSIESNSTNLRTVEEVLAAAEVDLTIWEVDRFVANTWDVAMKLHPGEKIESGEDGKSHKIRGADQTTTKTQWQIKIWLKRKIPKSITDGLEIFNTWATKYRPKYSAPKYRKIADPHLLEISLFDVHFGKLAWAPEAGQNYDLKIAETIYLNAFQDLIQKANGYNIDRIAIPIGQDMFHIDNRAGTTGHGTVMDFDSRYHNIFARATQAVVTSIDMAREVAPVDILLVRGNHDPTVSWHLAMYLSAWYRNVPGVTVDVSPKSRKYIDYGINLIGLTHGNEEKQNTLPLIMASEVPELWAKARHREIHTGHVHKEKKTEFVTADSYGPVVVRSLPSLSATDAWHYLKGYVGGNRAAEAYLYSHEEGYSGHFSTNAKEGTAA